MTNREEHHEITTYTIRARKCFVGGHLQGLRVLWECAYGSKEQAGRIFDWVTDGKVKTDLTGNPYRFESVNVEFE